MTAGTDDNDMPDTTRVVSVDQAALHDKPGKIWNELNQNSYYVYIIHVVVSGGIALILLNTAIPSILKYLILTVSTILVSNLIISLYRRSVSTIKLRRHNGVKSNI